MGHVLVLVLALVACKKSETSATTGSGGSDGVAPLKRPPAKKIDGPSVSPVVTNSVTFVAPKNAAWWGEMNFACYRAVMSLTGTKQAGEAFEKLSPNVIPAMAAGGIDLGRDLAAVGGYDCNGSPCMYVAATLDHPEKMGEVLRILVPGSPPKDLGKGHYQLETPGVNGPRTIHIRVVPIQWAGDLPEDRWSQESGKATYVVFIGGIDGKNADLDPLVSLGDGATGFAKVKEIETVLADTHGRCIIGAVGPRDFLPGFKIEKARFAVGAPETAEADPLMKLMGSKRSMDVQVELALSPAPTATDVDGWISMGKMYLGGLGDNVRSQFAGQGGLMDVYFDMLSLLGTKAFRHDIKGNAVRFSWRTDRVPAADLTELERRLQAAVGPGGLTP